MPQLLLQHLRFSIITSYYYICVLILLYVCPHPTIYVSSYYCTCPPNTTSVLILLYMCPHTKCPHTTIYVSSYHYVSLHYYICVLTLLYICPHTPIYLASSYYCISIAHSARLSGIAPVPHIYVSPYYYICVPILLYMCPHTTRAGIALAPPRAFLQVFEAPLLQLYMCPHTTIYVSSYYCICVLILILLYMCRALLQVFEAPLLLLYMCSYY